MNINFDINNFINDFQTTCHKCQIKTFEKNEVITTYIEKRNQLCILLSGDADLIRYDLNGNRTIVEHFSKNDLFGEVFYTITTNNELLAVAKNNCKVLFYIYNDIHNKCKNNCKFHQVLSENLPPGYGEGITARYFHRPDADASGLFLYDGGNENGYIIAEAGAHL